MSAYVIYYENGAKMMRPVLTAAEYRNLRDTEKQRRMVAAIREGNQKMKHHLLQMNYSCMPDPSSVTCEEKITQEGQSPMCKNGYPLKGQKTPSPTVGMDVDILRDENED